MEFSFKSLTVQGLDLKELRQCFCLIILKLPHVNSWIWIEYINRNTFKMNTKIFEENITVAGYQIHDVQYCVVCGPLSDVPLVSCCLDAVG